MPSEIVFPIGLVHRKVGPGAVLTEALFFPEYARLAHNRATTSESARRNLAHLLAKTPTEDLIRRRRAITTREHPFELVLPPPRPNEAWREPVTLRFHAVVWDHPNPTSPTSPGVVLARIVELGIEVIADPKDNLTEVLRREALSTLRRLNLSIGLRSLVRIQSDTAREIEWVNFTVSIPTLKERAIRAETDGVGEKKSLLAEIATALDPDRLDPAFEADEVVRRVAESLAAKPPQSVLLVGPGGVGKTAAVRELVRRRAEFHLGATPFFQTSGARLVAGQTGFGMWEQRCQEVIREASKRRAVLHVGPLVELMEVGKSEHNHSGIATFLRPAIARGEFLCIAECTPEQITLIEKQDPQLLDAFRQVTVEEPDPDRGRAILSRFAESFLPSSIAVPEGMTLVDYLRMLRRRRRPVPTDLKDRPLAASALAVIDRLHRRYATYSAYPGRPLRFLENLLRDGDDGVPITEPEVHEAFTRETGLPRSLIDPAVPLDLAATREWFSSRVVGQPEAVDLIVDLLATIKAGLTRPNRPIASLLFIGPTGVGKTEMAKALAEFLFGSRDRLTRFDMSEYADPISVRRLVGGVFGSEGLLTARIREQPFCVLLLDEIEKADGSVFDLLLQALGEARLTDAGGRLADFRNAVVILTSNLGAETYRTTAPGFAGGASGSEGAALASDRMASEAGEHFGRAVERFLRPEMFNRLDRIVPFAPLDSGVVRRIAEREWQKVLARDGIRFRGLSLNTPPALLDYLAAVGFDPRYGARPLKRAMERELLAPLARQLNRHAGEIPLSAELGVSGGKPTVVARPIPGAKPRSFREPVDPVGKLATAVQNLRRWHQVAETSSVVRELDNDVYQLSFIEARVLKKQKRNRPLTHSERDSLARLGRLREAATEVSRQRAEVFALEDETVLAFHAGADSPPADLVGRFADANREWDKLLLRLYMLSTTGLDSVTVVIYSEDRDHLAQLAEAYSVIASRSKLSVEVVRYVLPGSEADPRATTLPAPTADTVEVWRRGPPRPPGSTASDIPVPPTAWFDDRLFLTMESPPRELLRRVKPTADQPLNPLRAGTIGLGLTISGAGAHVRFCGEGGLHQFVESPPPESTNPDVLVCVVPESLLQYRPPETVVRRGFIKADQTRRVYELGKGQIATPNPAQVWTNLWGDLADRLEPILAAEMRARLVGHLQGS